MLHKKSSPVLIKPYPSQKQLELLYERRLVIDTLIESLEQYKRFQVQSEGPRKRKSA